MELLFLADTSRYICIMVYNVLALALLVLWGLGTFMFEAPGAIHLLLTVGVALWIWNQVRPQTPPSGR